MCSGLISGAKHWYRKAGVRSLLYHTAVYLVGSFVVRVTRGGYSNVLLSSEEFVEQHADGCYLELPEDTAGLSEQLCLDLVPLTDDDSLKFDNSPMFTFDTPFVVHIENAYVTGPHATVVTSDGNVLSDNLTRNVDRVRWMLNRSVS